MRAVSSLVSLRLASPPEIWAGSLRNSHARTSGIRSVLEVSFEERGFRCEGTESGKPILGCFPVNFLLRVFGLDRSLFPVFPHSRSHIPVFACRWYLPDPSSLIQPKHWKSCLNHTYHPTCRCLVDTFFECSYACVTLARFGSISASYLFTNRYAGCSRRCEAF